MGSDNLSQTIRMDCDHANHTGETHTHRQVAREKPDMKESVTHGSIYVKFRDRKTIPYCGGSSRTIMRSKKQEARRWGGKGPWGRRVLAASWSLAEGVTTLSLL